MRKRILQKGFLIISLCLLRIGLSQSNHLYYHNNPSPVQAGYNVEISQLLFTDEHIISGMLFFRGKGEMSYQEVEMVFESGKWVGVIPAHRVTIKGIEYVTIPVPKISSPFGPDSTGGPSLTLITRKGIFDLYIIDRHYVKIKTKIISPFGAFG